ncbi:spermatogenesis-associated protein 46 [Amia ocellicauda]|uniref:spermatogenesis-associated protein 46 n=1 Tax=Amia ocellicauda TaxID=2972642 RepID=UPI003463B68C
MEIADKKFPGSKTLIQCLKVQNKAKESSTSRQTPDAPEPLLALNPGQQVALQHQLCKAPESPGEPPKRAGVSHRPLPVNPCRPVATIVLAGGVKVDPMFIHTVTTAEYVRGVERYKCSGCLHYHASFWALQKHVENGWREGFSCRVFYHKLKIMRERKVQKSSPGPASSASDPPPSSRSDALKERPAEMKTDMIHKWLQNI